jgi:hypothetical protein
MSSFAATFDENPVPFRSTGCNASVPQGWYTTAHLQETGGVSFTPSTLIQKLDGNVADFLAESFNSRFGPCASASGSFNPGVIPSNGTVCDASGHTLTFDSPICFNLVLAARRGN